MNRKGMSTALVIVITIIVLLIVAVAVIALVTHNLSNLNDKTKNSIDKSMKDLDNQRDNAAPPTLVSIEKESSKVYRRDHASIIF